MHLQIDIDKERIAELCKKHHIRKLSFFGSILRKDFNQNSDIDILVEFEPGHTPGFKFISIQSELSRMLGNRKVDLVTPKFLNRRIRDSILGEAEVQYAQE